MRGVWREFLGPPRVPVSPCPRVPVSPSPRVPVSLLSPSYLSTGAYSIQQEEEEEEAGRRQGGGLLTERVTDWLGHVMVAVAPAGAD